MSHALLNPAVAGEEKENEVLFGCAANGERSDDPKEDLGGDTQVTSLLIPLVLLITAVPNSAAYASEPPSVGRYQLVVAKVPTVFTNGTTSRLDELFLVDSSTGNVWRFQPAKTIDDHDGHYYMFEHFEHVFVDDITGDYVERVKKLNNKLKE